MSQPFLMLNGVSAAYNKKNTISDISFSINEGQLTCLLGPSGCGKTTILRTISGFQAVTAGTITLDGRLLSNMQQNILPEQRNIGMVFQDHALFPHLTISQNVGFGLQKLSRSDRTEKITKMLSLIGLSDYRDRYPHELSGGQSQRVALVRAIAPEPKLLLMDEPFSNLDTDLRESLGYEIRNLLKEFGITSIMVTHDQNDAFALGDKIPHSRFVANFIGDGVLVKGRAVNENTVITSFGEISGQPINPLINNEEVDLLIRPDDVEYDLHSSIRAKVTRKAFRGAQTLYTLQTTNNDQLMSLLPSHKDYEVGDVIGLNIKPDHLVCFAI